MLLLAVIAIIVAFTVPEIRALVGLEKLDPETNKEYPDSTSNRPDPVFDNTAQKGWENESSKSDGPQKIETETEKIPENERPKNSENSKLEEKDQGGNEMKKNEKETSNPPYLRKRTIDNVEMRITGFVQEMNVATVFFELENKDAINKIRDFSIYPEYQELMDQHSNSYSSRRCKVGNLDYNTGNLPVKLVYSNTSPGLVEFEVSEDEITKITYLKIGLGIDYFEFTNVPISK